MYWPGARSPGRTCRTVRIASVYAEFLCGHFCAVDPVFDFLERDVARVIGCAVIWLHIKAEGRKPAIVGGADTFLADVVGRRRPTDRRLPAPILLGGFA